MKFFKFLKWIYIDNVESTDERFLNIGLTFIALGFLFFIPTFVFLKLITALFVLMGGAAMFFICMLLNLIRYLFADIKKSWKKFDQHMDKENRLIIAKLKGEKLDKGGDEIY